MEKVMIACIMFAWNIAVFLLYGIDKRKASKQKWRISEAVLIFAAILLGGFGATMGMIVFNHKTSKAKFRIFVPIALFLNIVAVCTAIAWW